MQIVSFVLPPERSGEVEINVSLYPCQHGVQSSILPVHKTHILITRCGARSCTEMQMPNNGGMENICSPERWPEMERELLISNESLVKSHTFWIMLNLLGSLSGAEYMY